MPEIDLMASNLKILYVVKHMPCPPVTGALLRVLNIGRQLKKCGHVTMIYVGRAFPAKLKNYYGLIKALIRTKSYRS